MKRNNITMGAACLALLLFADSAQAQRTIRTYSDGSFRSANMAPFRASGFPSNGFYRFDNSNSGFNNRGQFVTGPGLVDSRSTMRSNFATNPNGFVTTANPGFVNNGTPFRSNYSTFADGNYFVSPTTGLVSPFAPMTAAPTLTTISPPMSFTPGVVSVNFRRPTVAEPADPVTLTIPAVVREDEARIKVTVPTADARVWMEERLTQQTGLVRTFASPTLEAGKSYTYRIKASWAENGREVTREKEIAVRAGGEVEVDFREPVPEKVAPPRPD